MTLEHNNELAALMVQSTLGVTLAAPFTGHVVMKEGTPVGAFVVNNFDHVNCTITVVGEHCWKRYMMFEFARYVFGQLGCRRASARTRASNQKAIQALMRLGFQMEGVQRKGFGNEDALLFGLLAEDFRYMRKTGGHT